jgi:hypothetical protein
MHIDDQIGKLTFAHEAKSVGQSHDPFSLGHLFPKPAEQLDGIAHKVTKLADVSGYEADVWFRSRLRV